jgi:hypothetical protein
MAQLFQGYREMNARAFTASPSEAQSPEARAIGAMHVAFTDGLAIQVLVDPGGMDVQLVAQLWEDFVRHVRRRGEIDPDQR